MKSLFALLSLTVAMAAQTARAETVQVLTIESDAVPGVTTVSVVRDNGGRMTGLHAVTPERIIDYTVAQLQTYQVFKEVDGHQAVFLKLDPGFDVFKGGYTTMRYLHNGATGNYRTFRMSVSQQGRQIVVRSEPNYNDPESDRNDYTSVFNYLWMPANTFFGKTIGIDSVQPDLR